jgi:hypothetical protein
VSVRIEFVPFSFRGYANANNQVSTLVAVALKPSD